MLQGEKVLVTGPTGHLALPIVRQLTTDNEVWGLARFGSSEARRRLEELGVRCVRKDLATEPLDDLPDDFTVVVHAGAMVAMDSERDWAYTFQVNAQGTGKLMYHCRAARCFLHCSTGGVYQHQSRPVQEGDPLGMPIPAYSLSKIAAEQVVHFVANQWHVPTVILRIGAIYGPDATGPAVRIDRMVRGREVWVNPAKPNGQSLLWQDDAVELATKAMILGQVPPLVMNFGGSEPVSIEDYCGYAGELLGIEPRFRYTEETYPANFMDSTVMQQMVGEPKVSWREGIRRLVEHRYPDLVTAR